MLLCSADVVLAVCTRLRPRRLLLSSVSLLAGIYCPSKMLVVAVVVMAAVMVVNDVVGSVKVVEWLLVVACGCSG